MKSYWRLRYEQEFSRLVDARISRAFSLGREALVILLKALGVKEGDRIGVCGFTCLSVVEAVKVAGAIPVYLDIDEHLCIDPREISIQPRDSLKAVILQHTFGNPGKLDDLLEACEHIDALVIEDCAHALGCYWNEKPLGQFGEGAIYSFQWGKPYTTGQGGILTFNSTELIAKADQVIENWAATQSIKAAVILEIQRKVHSVFSKIGLELYVRSLYKILQNKGLINQSFKFDPDFKLEKGYIKFPDRLTSKEGLKQVKAYPQKMKARKKTVSIIEESLKHRNIALWRREKPANVTLTRYPIFVENKTEVLEKAIKKHLDIAGWYESPVHPLKNDDLLKVSYAENTAPNAEKYIKNLVHLPTNNPDEDKIELMLDTIFNE